MTLKLCQNIQYANTIVMIFRGADVQKAAVVDITDRTHETLLSVIVDKIEKGIKIITDTGHRILDPKNTCSFTCSQNVERNCMELRYDQHYFRKYPDMRNEHMRFSKQSHDCTTFRMKYGTWTMKNRWWRRKIAVKNKERETTKDTKMKRK